MGITERKAREKEIRRNDIVDAAERIFFTKGRLNATMDEVAEEVELSKGTIYLYFKNKEELFLAIHLRGLELLEKKFQEAFEGPKTGLEKIKAVGMAYNQFFQDYPDYYNALVYFKSHELEYCDENTLAAECHEKGERTIGIVAEAIHVGIKDGSIRPDLDPMKTATVLWGLTSGILQLISIQGIHLEKKHGLIRQEILDYAFRMIYLALNNE